MNTAPDLPQSAETPGPDARMLGAAQDRGNYSAVMAALEAFANAFIGLLVSWAATWFVLGYAPIQAIAVTLMFFALSFTRAYVLRLVFRGLS